MRIEEQNHEFENLLIRQPVQNCGDVTLYIFIYVCCKLSSRSIFTNQTHINDFMMRRVFIHGCTVLHTLVLGTNRSPACILVLVGSRGPLAFRI